MNIKTESGVFEVKQVRALVEKRFTFNGVKRRLCEITNKLEEANGLAIYLGYDATCLFDASAMRDFCILNLPNKYVQKVLDSLNDKGFADISDLTYQSYESCNPMNCYFANGNGKPYKTDIFGGLSYNNACVSQTVPQQTFCEDFDSMEGDDGEE